MIFRSAARSNSICLLQKRINASRLALVLTICISASSIAQQETPVSYSGIYPHLAMFNNESECGTGAVVPWADRLWVITYAPHKPTGSSDKLYEIDSSLQQTIRPESIGGTPANRMIHRESQQLFIGPYVIDADRNVRTIPYQVMYGRHTGNARHLFDPQNKIYYATMEEGIYEVDVKTLAVKELWTDEHIKSGNYADFPGYHGKGFYSGQGRLVYSNNGEHGDKAKTDHTIPSGVLAQWDGKADKWDMIRRNQFTEVTGPGGIAGSQHPESDPIWSIGWDYRSLILMCLDKGKWQSYRLPKCSHTYDGAHGWNTEWPRIRDIGDNDLLMTMHGMFWKFPKTFRNTQSAGIAPRSSYLKIVGDFAQWNDKIVLGCDDTALSEFLNTSRLKGKVAAPGQSQSNLVFLDSSEALDNFGPTLGRGCVWLKEPVSSDQPSDPFLFSGFANRGLHVVHDATESVNFFIEVNSGDGNWKALKTVVAAPAKATWIEFSETESGAWVRLTTDRDLKSVTASFYFFNPDKRTEQAGETFSAITEIGSSDYLAGLLRTNGKNRRTLSVAAKKVTGNQVVSKGLYELDASMKLNLIDNDQEFAALEKSVAVPVGIVERDDASVLLVDDRNRRWRLPKNDAYSQPRPVELRVAREVVTERNLMNVDGTFYELPANNAGGFSGLRPIATHHRLIPDFASYRGLMVMTGIRLHPAADKSQRDKSQRDKSQRDKSQRDKSQRDKSHIIRSADGNAAVWVGSIDDLWKFGKPRGQGGPWKNSTVAAGVASDPYLFFGYDEKSLTLSHDAAKAIAIKVEVDLTGEGHWAIYDAFKIEAGKTLSHEFPQGYSACWLRLTSDTNCTATGQLEYR